MIQTLPIGPFSLPVVPIFAMLAVLIGLDVAARYSRRWGGHVDHTWNTGMVAILACLIVARLWNVIQFWEVYASEPGLVVSLRPSGFIWLPGIVAGVVAGYLYLLWKALDPLRILAALSVGAVAAGFVQSVRAYLTGSLLGLPSQAPWALPYFEERRHPVALYEAAGLLLLVVLVQAFGRQQKPGRTVWWVVVGWSLLLLVTRAFVSEPVIVVGVRAVQVGALIAGLIAAWRLAHTAESAH